MVKRGEFVDFIKNMDVDSIKKKENPPSTTIMILKEVFEYIEELEKRLIKLEKR